MSGVKRYKLEVRSVSDTAALFIPDVVVDASDYDRDTAELRSAVSAWRIHYDRAMAERDELRAQVEAMRAALESAAKGILWLQASVPMSLRISKRASKDYNAAKRSALQAKP